MWCVLCSDYVVFWDNSVGEEAVSDIVSLSVCE